jgi:hypothetical protein
MIDDMSWKGLESGRDLIEELSRNFPKGTERNHEDIRPEHPPSTSVHGLVIIIMK